MPEGSYGVVLWHGSIVRSLVSVQEHEREGKENIKREHGKNKGGARK